MNNPPKITALVSFIKTLGLKRSLWLKTKDWATFALVLIYCWWRILSGTGHNSAYYSYLHRIVFAPHNKNISIFLVSIFSLPSCIFCCIFSFSIYFLENFLSNLFFLNCFLFCLNILLSRSAHTLFHDNLHVGPLQFYFNRTFP